MNKKQVLSLAAVAVMAVSSSLPISYAIAENKAYTVYGAAISESEQNQIDLVLEKSSENKDIINSEDYLKYIGHDVNDSALISSVMVEFTEPGSGIEVVIATPENITKVRNHQYINAALTAGIEDAKITVASMRPVTGESALAGIFKAMELHGVNISPEQAQLSQDELVTTIEIVDRNKDNEDFSEEKLTQIFNDIKIKIIQISEQKGEGNVTDEDIEVIVKEVTEENEANLSNEDIVKISGYMSRFEQTVKNIDSERLMQNMEEFGSKAGKFLKETYQQAEEAGLIDKLVEFFKSVVRAIDNFFSSITEKEAE